MRHLMIIFALLLIGCGTTKQDTLLYSTFLDYKESTNTANIAEISSDFFSENLLNNEDLSKPGLVEQLLFKTYMIKYVNSLEVRMETSGCLVINGFDSDNMPISFKLKYIESEPRWKIDEINVYFVNSVSEFSKVAKCPYKEV